MLTFATKTLSTGANGQKADGTSPFVRAVLKKAVMNTSIDPNVTASSAAAAAAAVATQCQGSHESGQPGQQVGLWQCLPR